MLLVLGGGLLAYLVLEFPWWVLVLCGLVVIQALEIKLILSLRGRPPLVGAEALVGLRGVLATADRVRLHGTTYPARMTGGTEGDEVVVEAVDGLTLVVRRPTEPS